MANPPVPYAEKFIITYAATDHWSVGTVAYHRVSIFTNFDHLNREMFTVIDHLGSQIGDHCRTSMLRCSDGVPGATVFAVKRTGTGLSRNTVRKYLAAAQAEGIAQEGPPPSEEQ